MPYFGSRIFQGPLEILCAWNKHHKGDNTLRSWGLPVSADSFNLCELAHLCCSLDVLKVDILIFAKVDDASEIVEQSFGSLVLLEEVNKSGGAEKIRVLGGNLYNGSEILANI